MPRPTLSADSLKILIVAEHASTDFGGEAALPLHYFRVLSQRGNDVWLISHSRVRNELEGNQEFDHNRIAYVEDNAFHQLMWIIGKLLPDRVSYITTGFASRLLTQVLQRRLCRKLVAEHQISVVHQPMPVSPREPSALFNLGAPVVIGPMNGGMDFPPAFKSAHSEKGDLFFDLSRRLSSVLHTLLPGKRMACKLLVANERTKNALPNGCSGEVLSIIENGADLAIWQRSNRQLCAALPEHRTTRFVFMGRLVSWKAVDIILEAFAYAKATSPMTLTIVGDGSDRNKLEQLARKLNLTNINSEIIGFVSFLGWQKQTDCASILATSDVLLLPSIRECGGAVVLEAMACELPVIATAWGGPLDYINESCGILLDPSSRENLVAGFAAAMSKLALDPFLRLQLGKEGRDRIEREFNWDTKVDKMIEIYRSAQVSQK